MKSITILGAGESGFGAAMLARQKGLNVFVSDSNKINEDRKLEMIRNSIMFEEENHSFDKIKLSDFVIKSPGISNSSEIISKIRLSGIPIVSEIEFASSYSNSFKISANSISNLIDKLFIIFSEVLLFFTIGLISFKDSFISL